MHSRRWHSIGIEVWWTYNYDDGKNIGHELTISPPHSPIDDDCSWRCSSFLITHCNSCPWWCSEPSCGVKVKIFLMVLDLPCHIMALSTSASRQQQKKKWRAEIVMCIPCWHLNSSPLRLQWSTAMMAAPFVYYAATLFIIWSPPHQQFLS